MTYHRPIKYYRGIKRRNIKYETKHYHSEPYGRSTILINPYMHGSTSVGFITNDILKRSKLISLKLEFLCKFQSHKTILRRRLFQIHYHFNRFKIIHDKQYSWIKLNGKNIHGEIYFNLMRKKYK